MTLVERLRAHVINRGGMAKDANGNVILPNGAWSMMLEAADALERIGLERDALSIAVLTLTNERDDARAK
jgi:hypothetical protein